MANTTLTTDLVALHDAIVRDIQAKFPFFQTVEFYRTDRKTMPTPACILELDELPTDESDDPGNGQISLEARFVAHLVLGFKTDEVRLKIRKLAASVAAFLKNRHFAGVTHGACKVDGAYEDDFMPELDQFECWRVEWSCCVYIGDDVWDESGFTAPTQVFTSFDPDIGVANKDKYTNVTG